MPLNLRFPWSRPDPDPYWDRFINGPLADPSNLPVEAIRRAPEGSVFAVKADVHTPEIMAGHIKELAKFFGADAVGIVRLRPNDDSYPLAVVCAFKAEYDPERAPGIGGQKPAIHGAFVTFNLGSALREYGYRATKRGRDGAERLAAAAGLGTVTGGRLISPSLGPLYVADIIHTDIPLAADGEEPA